MQRTTPTLRLGAAALLAASILVAGCSSSGGSDDAAKSDKTTTTKAEATTTTADETTTTEASTPTDGPTTAELTAILPTADELGQGWGDDTTVEDGESAIETATKEQCPDAAALLAPAEDDEATAAFVNDPDATTVRVTLSPAANEIDPADMQAIVDSINDCDAVTASEDGFDYTVSLAADLNDTYGDQGIQLDASVNITDGTDSYDLHKYRLLYRVGTVGVTISGDGLQDDGTVTAIDGSGLEAVAAEMESRVKAL